MKKSYQDFSRSGGRKGFLKVGSKLIPEITELDQFISLELKKSTQES